MERTKWTERVFTFDMPEGWMPNVIERLRGTPARLRSMIKGYSNATLSHDLLGWSIKEHIGHLLDLEPLHEGRIDDLIDRKEQLRAADMSNERTNEAGHNEQDAEYLIDLFEASRDHFISRLQRLEDNVQYFKAMHPRLHVMMRPIDVAYFSAEHDDHHLASISRILNIPE